MVYLQDYIHRKDHKKTKGDLFKAIDFLLYNLKLIENSDIPNTFIFSSKNISILNSYNQSIIRYLNVKMNAFKNEEIKQKEEKEHNLSIRLLQSKKPIRTWIPGVISSFIVGVALIFITVYFNNRFEELVKKSEENQAQIKKSEINTSEPLKINTLKLDSLKSNSVN